HTALHSFPTRTLFRSIQKAAYDFQRAVETKEQIVVGVNEFAAEQERTIPLLRMNEEIERSQVARLQALRAKRDSAKTQAAIAERSEEHTSELQSRFDI